MNPGFSQSALSVAALWAPIPYYNPIITIDCFDSVTRVEKDLEVYYLLSDFITAFMFIRLYFLIRTIGNYSKYTETFGVKGPRNEYIDKSSFMVPSGL